jgi:hypothetical protein
MADDGVIDTGRFTDDNSLQVPGDVEPYANDDYTRPDGAASFAYGRAHAVDDLTGYGTQDGGVYNSTPDDATPAGPRAFDADAEHSRATAAQAPSYSRDGTYPSGIDGRDGVPGTRKEDMPRLPTRVDQY